MPEEGAPNNPKNKVQSKPETNGKKNLRPAWLSDIVGGWGCAFFAGLLGLVGSVLLNSHPKPLIAAWVLICIAITCMGGTAYFWLSNHRKRQSKHKMPDWMPMAFFIGIAVIGLIISGYAVWQERPDPSPEPVITVEPGPSMIPQDSFATPFVLVNHGPGTIYHIQHSAWWTDPAGPGKRMLFSIHLTNFIPELKPFVTQELPVNPDFVHPRLTAAARMDLEVRYMTANFQNITNIFQFVISTNGGYQWHSYGEGESFEKAYERLKNIPPPKSPDETNPFIKIGVKSFTNTDLAFSLENIGGASAMHIALESEIVRGSDEVVVFFSHETNQQSELGKYQLVPGATEFYDIWFPPDFGRFYDGILSNDLFLGVKIHYQNVMGAQFGNTYKVTHTNEGFEIEYIDNDTNIFRDSP